MRSLRRLLLIALFFSPAFLDASNPVAPPKASEIFLPVGSGVVSVQQLAHMKAADFSTLSGKKMNLGDRIGFWLMQKKLRKAINADGTVDAQKVQRINPAAKFHFGGFLLGLFLGIIGVLIAYFINDDKKLARTRWAWIGFAAWVALVLLVII